jgi:hypothetical protein
MASPQGRLRDPDTPLNHDLGALLTDIARDGSAQNCPIGGWRTSDGTERA